jgi:hypothetical protein
LIKERFKGFHEDNEELTKEYLYWFFALYFGYTPEQVDNLSYDRQVYFHTLQMEQIKRNQEYQIKIIASGVSKAFNGR